MKDFENKCVITGVAVVMMALTYTTFSTASDNEFDNSAMPEFIYDTETPRKLNSHTVVKGDTVYSIARLHGLDPRTLMRDIGCGKCDNLTVGQEINLD